jgi:hypothetical protein
VREAAAQDIKACFVERLQQSETWWRRSAVIIAVAVILATLFGAPLDRLLGVLDR